MKKPRSDYFESRLTPDQVQEMDRWLLVENVAYTEIQARLEKACGSCPSLGSLSAIYKRAQARSRLNDMKDKLANASDLADGLQESLRAAAPTLGEATIQMVAQRAFEAAVNNETDPDVLVPLVKLGLATRKLDLYEKAINLDVQKFQWDAARACLAMLPELNSIAGQEMPDDAKTEAIGQKIFGDLWK